MLDPPVTPLAPTHKSRAASPWRNSRLLHNGVSRYDVFGSHKEPETITELAAISGRELSNVSRTLKTLERYGIGETRKTRHSKRPIAKATGFHIQLSAR